MKLLISLSYYSPHISGLTIAMQHLADLLAANGFHVTVLAAQHEKHLPHKQTMHGVTVIRVPYLFRVSKGFVMPNFISNAYLQIYNADAVLITLPQPEGFFVALLAKLLGRKVYCLYICEVTLAGGVGAKLIEALLRVINRMTVALADTVITLTDDFANHNPTLRNVKKQVIGIYPVVIPPKVIAAEVRALRGKLPHKTFVIGYLGRISSEKGIEYLLEAIPLLQKELGNELVLLFAGPKRTVGEGSYRKRIDRLLMHYAKFVVYLGELSNEQLGAFYSVVDVFVLPSINNTEVFGMVQVEAMYCGTPIVTTNLPGVRVPVRKTGMGEIVPPADTTALAQAIVDILHNKKKYVKDYEQIAKEFSVKNILKAYREIFN